MIRFLKLYFVELLFIVLIIIGIYFQRDWLCNEYNRMVDLRVTSLMKDKNETYYIKMFAEQSKDQFAYRVDSLVAIAFGGLSLIIVRQFNKKHKSKGQ